MPWVFAGLLRWIFSSASGSEVIGIFRRNVLPSDAVISVLGYPRWLFFVHLGVCLFVASGLLIASRLSRNAVSNLVLVANILLLAMAFINLGLERRWFAL